jgi:hypothetical protein
MRARDLPLIVVSAVAGAAIAFVDSRPGWDDTGITVGLLVVAAATIAAVSGRRPLLWALLVGAWTPAFELFTGGSVASLAALGIAAVGAFAGWVVRRSLAAVDRPGTPPT